MTEKRLREAENRLPSKAVESLFPATSRQLPTYIDLPNDLIGATALEREQERAIPTNDKPPTSTQSSETLGSKKLALSDALEHLAKQREDDNKKILSEMSEDRKSRDAMA